jgi:hypothetical protein
MRVGSVARPRADNAANHAVSGEPRAEARRLACGIVRAHWCPMRILDKALESGIGQQATASWRRPSLSGAALFALCIAIGALYAFVVVGPRVLNPLDVSWLIEDPMTGYLGWAFFRWETQLRIPLGWASAIGYPLGTPVAYLDSIPLLATLGWILGGLLPEDFQYFGLYFLLCSALQFYFGFRISRRMFGGDTMAGVLGGCFFLAAPAFAFRARAHFALASHWFILAALDQFLRATAPPSWARVAGIGVLCFIAASINPYIAMMALLVCCAAYARPLLLRNGNLLRAGTGIAVASCSVLSGLILFGFLRSADASQYAGGGYSVYSMNLLAPIDPGLPGALLLKQQPTRQYGQIEGYGYLGLGLMLLGFASAVRNPAVLRRMFSRSWSPALAVYVISLLLALSTQGTVGPYFLYKVDLPGPVMTALASFRASGRLFWPGYYLLFIGILAAASWSFRGRRLHAALAAALIVQLLDLSPLRAMVHHAWQTAVTPAMPADAAWHGLGRAQKHLIVLPAWQCSPPDTPGGMDGYAIFGRLALEQHMTINSYYAGRYSDAQLGFFCTGQVVDIQRQGLRGDTAYVLPRDKAAWVAGLKYNDHYCRYVGNYILCSSVRERTGIDPAIAQDIASLDSGDVISFSKETPAANRLLGFGWSAAEPWGRWMDGDSASLIFKSRGALHADRRIERSVQPFLTPAHPMQRIDVLANGTLVAQRQFRQPGAATLDFVVPGRVIGADGLVRLDIQAPDAASPASLGMGADPRRLSIGVIQLHLAGAGN